MSDENVARDPAAYQKLARESRDIGPIVDRYRAYKAALAELTKVQEMIRSESDPELREMAHEEMRTLEARRDALDAEICHFAELERLDEGGVRELCPLLREDQRHGIADRNGIRLDPNALLAGKDVAIAKTREVLDRVGGRRGHIFNLGHGILPETDPSVLAQVVETVHSYDLGAAKTRARSEAPAREEVR